MSLFALLCVLALEQIKALPTARLEAAVLGYADFLEQRCNAGERRHGLIAWGLGVALPAALVGLIHLGLLYLHGALAFLFTVAVLYLTLGFRQFSHFFTDIQLALRMGELERARQLIADWRGRSAERLGSGEIVRLAIEEGILASHRHVFAPLFWFLLLGPGGAVLYRLAWLVAARWRQSAEGHDERGAFAAFADQASAVLDGIPARLTAATFAIVGDFEDAVYCWRTQASQWPRPVDGILLASGAGALGIRLGLPLPEAAGFETRPELGLGDEADVDHLQSAIGLVWRALVLCLLVLALLTVASWVGS